MNNDNKLTLFYIFNIIQKPIILYIIKVLDILKILINKFKDNIDNIKDFIKIKIDDLYEKWEEIKPTPLGKKIIKYTQTYYLIAYFFIILLLIYIIKILISKIPKIIINIINNFINNFIDSIDSIKMSIINFIPGNTFNIKILFIMSIILLIILYKTGGLQIILKYIGQFLLFLMYLVNLKSGIQLSIIFITLVIFCFMAKLLLNRIRIINSKKNTINNLTTERSDSLQQYKDLSNKIKNVDGQIGEFKYTIKKQLNNFNNNKKLCKKDNILLHNDYTNLISNIPSKIDNIISSSVKDNSKNLRKFKKEIEKRKTALLLSRRNELNKINNEINNAKTKEQERIQ